MCFSTSASFAAGITLTVIGVASIKKVKDPSQFLFASIPFLFGVQQFAEGVLWLTIPNSELLTIKKIFTSIFLFFAQFL